MKQVERFRGSSELPLTDAGVAKAHDLAMKLATKGGLSEIVASSLGRTVNTAKIISHYTHAPITDITTGLHPWHLGTLEGQEITPDGIQLQKDLVDHPDVVSPIAGRGPRSTADGESFNAFKDRSLGYLKQLISRSAADPQRAIGAVTHYRVKKLLEAWMRRGMDPSGDIDSEFMNTHDESNKPGGVERLSADPYAGPQLSDVDLDGPGKLLGGLYLIRHEATPWNSSDGS